MRAIQIAILLGVAATAAASSAVNAKDIASIYMFSEQCATCQVPEPQSSCGNYTMKDYCINFVFGNNMANCALPGTGVNCWYEKCSAADKPASHTSIWAYGCYLMGEKRNQLVECAKHGAGKAEVSKISTLSFPR